MEKEHSKTGNSGQLPVSPEVVEVEELDVEEFSKMHGGKPPKAKRYIIRIDREKYTVNVPEMTGRQILELAKKLPPENWLLNQKLKGGRVVAIGLNDSLLCRRTKRRDSPTRVVNSTSPKRMSQGLMTAASIGKP
jgi:Multiubiquitin